MGGKKDEMHAALLHARRDLRYEQVPIPSPRPDEVLVRIVVNGLCGSDIHFYREGRLGPFKVTCPYIPGLKLWCCRSGSRTARRSACGAACRHRAGDTLPPMCALQIRQVQLV